jgi:hypothetical protein
LVDAAKAISDVAEIFPGHKHCERLMMVPGIGPIISSAIVAAIGTGDGFSQ